MPKNKQSLIDKTIFQESERFFIYIKELNQIKFDFDFLFSSFLVSFLILISLIL